MKSGAASAQRPPWSTDEAPIRIGVSACLLGENVRYDGGHKRDAFLVDVFGRFVEWVPVCPEMELGLGAPRPTMRLERRGDEIRLVTPSTRADHTGAMRRYAERRLKRLAADELSGYVLKKDSPSCGMERVKEYEHGTATRSGRGLFAAPLLQRFPLLPVEEEGRLNDAALRENFIERVFAYRRLRSFFARRWTVGGLVAFHTAHKLQLLSHSPALYSQLGRLVAGAKTTPREELRRRYENAFMAALGVLATRRRQVDALQHIAGYFRGELDPPARRELESLIDDYRRGLVPLVVPLTLILHHVRRLDVEYLRGQVYLEPHPRELMLRNHV